MQMTFTKAGDFAAMYEAEDWCKQRGISVGSGQRDQPRGLLFGDFAIAKWRNLSDADRSDLHGTMTGDMRNGPITITINLDAEQRLFAPAVPPVHLAAN